MAMIILPGPPFCLIRPAHSLTTTIRPTVRIENSFPLDTQALFFGSYPKAHYSVSRYKTTPCYDPNIPSIILTSEPFFYSLMYFC